MGLTASRHTISLDSNQAPQFAVGFAAGPAGVFEFAFDQLVGFEEHQGCFDGGVSVAPDFDGDLSLPSGHTVTEEFEDSLLLHSSSPFRHRRPAGI